MSSRIRIAGADVTISVVTGHKASCVCKTQSLVHSVLFAIAVVFAGSWLPLNVFNIVADFDHAWVLALDRSGLIFAVCASQCFIPAVTAQFKPRRR